MFKFLVWHVLIVTGSCELFKEESGYTLDYAPRYDNYKPRDYHFNYAVSDPHTGDHKSQWEVKINGVVRGGYSLLEPDGTTRVVEYVADDDGFRAAVNKIGTSVHSKVIQPQVPVIPLQKIALYRAYDGQIGNYAPAAQVVPTLYSLGHVGNALSTQTIGTVDARPVVPQSHNIIQQEPVLSDVVQEHNVEVSLPIETVPQSISTIETTPQNHNFQGQDFGNIGAYRLETGLGSGAKLESLEVVPLVVPPVQGHGLSKAKEVPVATDVHAVSVEGQDWGREVVPLGVSAVSGYNIKQADVVPVPTKVDAVQVEGQDWSRGDVSTVDRLEAVPIVQPHGTPFGTQRIPVQKFTLGGLARLPNLNRYDIAVGRVNAVPNIQGQNIGIVPLFQGQLDANVAFQKQNLQPLNVENAGLSLQRYNLEVVPPAVPPGHNLGGLDINVASGLGNAPLQAYLQGIHINNKLVPLFESYDAGTGVRVPLEENSPQPHVEIQATPEVVFRREVPSYQGQVVPSHQGQAIPNEVPVSPSYRTTIDFQGLADSDGLRKDVYHASYSEKVLKVVPSPRKKQKQVKKEFLIYIPDSESN